MRHSARAPRESPCAIDRAPLGTEVGWAIASFGPRDRAAVPAIVVPFMDHGPRDGKSPRDAIEHVESTPTSMEIAVDLH